ncbi:MAG: urease accessory protein UreD [Oscillospiraceae bacterium]|nr:urease accessory protein UreD [Oscillospiraceae bacterium]
MKGSHGVLRLETARRGKQTVLKDCYFEAPYKVTSPFADPDGSISVIVMYASAGILENDTAFVELHAGRDSCVRVTNQSYGKIFKMEQGGAVKDIRISVDKGARLAFLPKPVIPFAGSRFQCSTQIEVARGGSLVYRDILSCGRLARGEEFAFESYRTRLSIRYSGRLVLNENVVLEPKQQNLSSLGYYEGFTHQATLCFVGETVPEAEKAAALLQSVPGIAFGVTSMMLGGLMVRMLGTGAEQLLNACDAVTALF